MAWEPGFAQLRKQMTEDLPSVNGSDLCTRCGLCCHGLLHEWGNLELEEIERLSEIGLKMERRRDVLVFSLPCSHVAGTVCTIYQDRPDACAGYRCALLKSYQAGEIPLGDAIDLVGKAQRLLSDVTSRLAPGETYRDFKTAWRAHMSGEKPIAWKDEEKTERAETFVALTLLNRFIDRHFRLGRETLLVSPERAAELAAEYKLEDREPPGPPSA